jgi:hypothetical protein
MITTAIVIALVAGVRKYTRIDGPWVVLLAFGCALIASGVQALPDWQAWLRLAVTAWIGAVGGMTAVQQLIDRASPVTFGSESPTNPEGKL